MGVYISDSNGKLQKFAGLGKKDIVPTENSKNAVESGGVYSFVNNAISSSENLALSWGHDNLLINGDFSINQRGATTYTATASNDRPYTVDRWRLTTENSTCSVLTNGVRISPAGANEYIFYQFIENPQRYAGLTLTFTIKFENNNNNLAIRLVDNNGNTKSKTTTATNGILSVTRTLGATISSLRCIVNPQNTGGAFDVIWAKCEIGGNSTAFVPRPYPEELSLCQRYYLKIKGNSGYGLVGTGFVYSSTRAFISVPLPTTMRTVPTYNGSGARRLLVPAGYKDYSSFSVDSICAHTISCRIDGTGFTAGQGCGFYFYNDYSAYIDFDAEMY